MGADPEPDDIVLLANSKSSIVQTYPNRVDVTRLMDSLESQTGMTGIILEEPVRFPRFSLDVVGQAGKRLAEGFRRP